MKILGLIPARSGSKGIPGKNIRMFGGKPLLAWTIDSALAAEQLDDIVVSTDSDEIAEIARAHHASVPFLRPDELAQDATPTTPVVMHALQTLAEHGKHYDSVCVLQPTSPFRTAGAIDSAIKQFASGGFDSLVSVLPVPHEFNPHWTFVVQADDSLRIATGDSLIIPRRQELPAAYYRDGSIYLTKVAALGRFGTLLGGRLGYVRSDPRIYVNLDTMADWARAEEMLVHGLITGDGACVE